MRDSKPLLLTLFALLVAGCGLHESGSSGAGAGGLLGSEPQAESSEQAAAETKPKHVNRLGQETSPYLLLHAHNPVDWYPWGPEALARAKEENKLIFLSIGYSSCHWCHVMERESFMDEEIAELLNEHFVCIKVDREERPDIDSIYMTSLHVLHQLMGQPPGGGWPLSMFLTPDAEPVFGGTYFPARDGDRGRATGFLTILKRIHDVWKDEPQRLLDDAKTLTRITKAELESQPAVAPRPLTDQLGAQLGDQVQAALAEQFDPRYGGFGYQADNDQRPKFPEPANLVFLLDRITHRRAAGKDESAELRILVKTLEHMAMGGIRDHLGGGFHRYSVDRYWSIPHFEKMLYDNAQLAGVYARAAELTGRDDFRRVAEETLEYLLREMRDEQGGFYAALDAETEGEEGKYYRWDRSEVLRLLDPDDQMLFASIYQLSGPPNFERQFYVPQLAVPLATTALEREVDEAELEERLAKMREQLRLVRDERPRPLTDTKILTGWNGLAITGLADVGRITGNERYVEAARKAAQFVLAHLRTEDGRLLASHSGGEAKLNAYLNDYAFLVEGLLALYRATGEQEWLDEARQLTDKQIELFWDGQRHGFYFTSNDHESLLARAKEFTDNVTPSGNSISAQNLLDLDEVLERPDFREKARQTIEAALPHLERSPAIAPRMATAAARLFQRSPAD
jgi:uncharacterized protein